MPYIQLEGQQYPLVVGENAVGSGADSRIRLPGGGVETVSAVLVVGVDGATVVRRGREQAVKVNGVTLGLEPAPLLHGDKIEIAGHELDFGEDRQAGNTQYMPHVKLPGSSAAEAAPPARKPTAATGGRIVSLVDGREYAIPVGGLVIGRDPTCDVVVSSTEVSRKHAVIAPSPEGYLLTDTSSNGVLVNGKQISAPTLLGKGDVVSVGADEFRFHADIVSTSASSAAIVAATRTVLATLEVTSSGLLKGKKFEIVMPLSHLGRGAHNDVVIADESVSDAHAKLQKREAGWFVVDMASTNGTYVGGRRITAEQKLVGAPDLRIGGVKFIFRPMETAEEIVGVRTRAIASLKGEVKGRTTAKQPEAKPSTAPVSTPPSGSTVPTRDRTGPGVAPERRGVPFVGWLLAVLAIGALVLYLLTNRS